MLTRFMWIKRKPLAAVVICAILTMSIALWQMNQVGEAAVLNPHPGLVGWWRFDEGTGTTAKDSSEYGNQGTINGATWINGKESKALSFDGADDYVEVPYSLSLDAFAELTVSVWIYPTLAGDGIYRHIVDKGWLGTGAFLIYFADNSATLKFSTRDTDGTKTAYSSDVLAMNQWYHVVAVFKKGQANELYVNGVKQVDSVATKDELLTRAANLRIAKSANDFQGTIDEVRIYNRALIVAEIQAIFQKKPDFSSKLLAKIPKGTTQATITISWQGTGSINCTIESPSQSFTEDMVPVYQKTVYSTSGDTSGMLNIKRLSVSVTALLSDENWYIVLKFDRVEDYKITVEVQK